MAVKRLTGNGRTWGSTQLLITGDVDAGPRSAVLQELTAEGWADLILGSPPADPLADGDYGDIALTLGGTVWTINPAAVGLAKMANRAAGTIIGRAVGAGTGAPQELTGAQVGTVIGMTAAGLALIDDADAPEQRITLGLSYATAAEVRTATEVAKVVSPATLKPREHLMFACSDEATLLTAGTAKITWRMPYAFTLTEVRASVTIAPTGTTLLTVDINEGGTSILSTKLTFDSGEETTFTAATPAVISDTSLANDAKMTVDIDSIGSTEAGAGLKVILIGHRT